MLVCCQINSEVDFSRKKPVFFRFVVAGACGAPVPHALLTIVWRSAVTVSDRRHFSAGRCLVNGNLRKREAGSPRT
jgi:hypothetical protein